MMFVEFTIPGPPQGKGRPRFSVVKGHIHTRTPDDTVLYENLVLWRMYMDRKDEKRILLYDKAFHAVFYRRARLSFWYELSERYAPLFDRTTILSFRVRPTSRILSDHEELVHAVEERDAERAGAIAESHMSRYLENIPEIISAYPAYFAKKD